MLGGGNFTTQNKVLPGTYINFVNISAAKSAVSDRGVAAVPLILDWGSEKTVMEVTAKDFQTQCFEIFGYDYEDAQMMPIREIFRNITKGIFYRMGTGLKAANTFATAIYGGIRGNVLTTVIKKNINNENKYDVVTMFADREVDRQTVAVSAELKNNAYVVFRTGQELTETVGEPFTGGTAGESLTGDDYSAFLAAMEPYSFHALCCPVTDTSVKALFCAFTKRMRDEAGVKFQTVVYRHTEADHEGIISVENKAAELEQGLVYWIAGIQAACAVNRTNEHKRYDGELTVDTAYTQAQLTEAVRSGKFMFHKSGNEVRVLMDINTLTTYTSDKGGDFGNNQTVRILDQIGNDIAVLFNTRYLGNVPNDGAGRVSLWNDIVTYTKELARMRAVETVESKAITVAAGETKRSVIVNCPVTPINCMSQLYMTIVVN